ncbi:MAG: hypothetical protein K5694_03060 [Bacilli bacterium]|nr:hypothetical protein [Bacilli bacterium]
MDEITKVRTILEGPLREVGYSLAEVNLTNGKDGLSLNIIVDKDDPISLDDIVRVSEIIDPILEKEDPIKGPYVLDVSSLGAEKPIALDKLEKYVSRYVNLHLSNPYKGENILEGTLLEVTDSSLTLSVKVKSRKVKISLPREDVDKARLAIEF